jgi:putative transposase
VPWSEITPMSQRLSFIRLYCQRRQTMAELCAEFHISEKTGYKWVQRFSAEGEAGLADRSHAPHAVPHRMPAEIASQLLALRRAHPTWGPRKLRAVSEARDPAIRWPAPSSIGALLKSAGLVKPRRRHSRTSECSHWGRTPAYEPNAVWTADFKGQFRLGGGPYCYPLTVVDSYSRFLLACRALRATDSRSTIAVFRELFQEYGLPRVLRTDNGVPFATRAIAGLSPLAVWCIRLGIRPERIERGQPQQNGRHERLHKTLKAETARPAASSFRTQQQWFDTFRVCYNGERPHEALGQRPPVTNYECSPRPYPAHLPRLRYAPGVVVRRVTSIGQFAWQGKLVWLTSMLAGQDVGLEEVDGEHWTVSFGPLILGDLNPHTRMLVPAVRWAPPSSPLNPV